MSNNHMGILIATLRKEKGLTQRELADKLQVTDKAVSKWERGLSCPDLSVLPQVAQLLGVTVDDLLSQHAQSDKRQAFRELNKEDLKEVLFLLCRCVSLALSIGGLLIYLLGGLTVSDLVVMLCIAVSLLCIERFGQ